MLQRFHKQNAAPPRCRHSRQQGAVYAVDLIVGALLLVLVPFLIYVVALSLGFAAEDLAEKQPHVPPPATDEQEVKLHWRVASDLYQRNAKEFLDGLAATSEDPILSEKFRRWAKRCLENSDSELQELEVLVRQYPSTQQKFSSRLHDSAALRVKITHDLQRLNNLDVLQLDSR